MRLLWEQFFVSWRQTNSRKRWCTPTHPTPTKRSEMNNGNIASLLMRLIGGFYQAAAKSRPFAKPLVGLQTHA